MDEDQALVVDDLADDDDYSNDPDLGDAVTTPGKACECGTV